MAAIWMPPPAEIVRPSIVEPYGVMEVYGDGGIVHYGENVITTVIYRRYAEGDRQAVLRILMPRRSAPEDGFEVSLIRAYLDAMGGVRH